jgi:hypothetical protein
MLSVIANGADAIVKRYILEWSVAIPPPVIANGADAVVNQYILEWSEAISCGEDRFSRPGFGTPGVAKYATPGVPLARDPG